MIATVDEILAMGKEGFVAAMLAEWEAKLARPDLSPEARERARRVVDRAKSELARRARQAAEAAAREADPATDVEPLPHHP